MNVAAFWSLFLLMNYIEQRSAITLRLFHFMLTAMVLYVCHYVYFSMNSTTPPMVDVLYRYCNLAVYTLYYVYIRTLTFGKDRWWKTLILLTPAILLSLLSLRWEGALVVMKIVFALQVVWVLWMGYRRLKVYVRLVEANYADTEQRSLKSIRALLYILAIISLVSFAANLIGRESFRDSIALLAIPSVLFSMLIFMLGYIGNREVVSVLEMRRDMEEDEQEPAELSVAKFESLKEKILTMVDEEKLYLQPNLKINDLARRIGTNRNYIYNAINIGMGMSFSDFINRRRIDYAIRLLQANKDKGIPDVYEECGFSSLSAFYRNFKSYKGCSPADYLDKGLEG